MAPGPMSRLAFQTVVPLLCAALLAACDNVDYIDLTPASLTFTKPTEKKYLEAKCMSRAGQRNSTARVNWSVKDPDIASVDTNGTVKPLKSGLTEVVARFNDRVEARALVNVLFTESISVEPKAITVTQGAPAVPVKVTVLGFDGRVLEARPAVFVSRDKKVASVVSGNGNAVMGLDSGSTVIDVTVDGKTAEIQVVVEAEKTK